MGKVVKVCLLLLLCSLIQSCIKIQPLWNSRGQGRQKRPRSFGDLGQRSHASCLSTFSKGLSSETTRPILFKFHMQPPSKGGMKVCIFVPGPTNAHIWLNP